MTLFEIPSRGSFRRQIVLTFVVGFFFLIAAFATYLVWTESDNLHRDSINETTSMAQTLAASALPWVLANDVAGLQEVVHAHHAYPELSYAMVISPTGRVLAHTEASKVGMFLADENSLSLLKAPPENRIIADTESVIDVAVPIEMGGQHVGWARVGSQKKENIANLRRMIWHSMLFLLLSTVLSFIAATLIADRLGGRIESLVLVAKEVQAGNFFTRASIPAGEDEIARLATSLNKMLDTLSQNEQDLRVASLYTRNLIEASLDPLVTISPEGKITDVNEATEKATGISRSELIGTDFSNYFTEPDRARQGYQQVFLRGSVTDYPLALRHRDGHVTDVLYNASVYRKGSGNVLGVFAAARDITERKKAEEQLRAASLYTRSLIEASLDPLVTISREGKITDVNKATEEVTGRSRTELIGTDFSDYFTEPHKARAGYQEAFEKNFVTNYPLALRHRDGHVTEVLYNASVYHNEAGVPSGVFAAARDVTERNRAERDLAQLSLRNKLILDSAGEGIYGLNTDGRCTFVNPAASQLLGFAIEELVGRSAHSMFHHSRPDGSPYPLEECPVQAACKQGVAHRGVDWYWRKDGSSFPVEFVSTPIIETQKTTGAVVTFSDITERMQAEEKLRASEKKFRSLTDTSPLAIYMSSGIEQKAEYINPTFTQLFGYTLEEVPTVAQWWPLAYPDEEYRKQVSEEWQRKVEQAIKTNSAIEPMEVVVTCKDGTKKNISWGYISTGVQNWAFGLDLTEREKAEEEVRRLNTELEERVKERTAELESFSYSVSHDLRVPLRAVDGFSRILLEEYDEQLDEEGKRLLGVVRDNTVRMARLIDDILAFSRLGRKEMASQEVDMAELAKETAAELAPSWAGRNVKLELGPLPPAYGDAAMVRQIWVNLISNAAKFTRPTATAVISIGGHTEGSEAVYYVRDNGVGFDMQYSNKLFGVFQRLHGTEEFEGTGAGLAIVKRIVTRHGGRVWAEGKTNEGATFYFTLPTAEHHDPARAENQDPAKEREHG